jgi:predicted TIM-barrel fold metal-dependent hydrolase
MAREESRLWGKPADIPSEYLVEELLSDADGLNLVKSVHVQTGYDPTQPAGETEWLQSLADAPGAVCFPHAIVAFADLSSPDIQAVLEANCCSANMRGIRQMLNRHSNALWNMSPREYLKDPAWRRNFALLGEFGLSFDLQLYYQQIDDAITLARENSEILLILNHAGMPADRDDENIDGWRRAIVRLADCPNVVAKISGLAMVDWNWTVESIRPFVLHVIEAFGADRCMFGSNFPVDSNRSSYEAVWNAFDAITSGFSEAERARMFHENAEKYYRI